MSDVRVSSVNVPTAASMSAQVSARRNRVAGGGFLVPAGSDKDTLSIKNQAKFDVKQGVQSAKESSLGTQKGSAPSAHDLTLSQAEAGRAKQLSERQVDVLNREVSSDEYKASAYAAHGNKGTYVDFST